MFPKKSANLSCHFLTLAFEDVRKIEIKLFKFIDIGVYQTE